MKLLCAVSALWCLAAAIPVVERSLNLSPRDHTVSPYTSSIKRRVHNKPHPLLRKRQTTASIVDNEQLKFLLPITFGTQTLDAELDTGSSDTWLIQSGFTCYSSNTFSASSELTESQCNFGGTYTPDSTFTPLSGVTQLSCYGDGARCVAGPLGYSSVSLCGLTIPSQLVGVPSQVCFPHHR